MHQSESALKTYRTEPLGQEVNHVGFSKVEKPAQGHTCHWGVGGRTKALVWPCLLILTTWTPRTLRVKMDTINSHFSTSLKLGTRGFTSQWDDLGWLLVERNTTSVMKIIGAHKAVNKETDPRFPPRNLWILLKKWDLGLIRRHGKDLCNAPVGSLARRDGQVCPSGHTLRLCPGGIVIQVLHRVTIWVTC